MKDYELTIVFHPDLEMNIDPALEKVKNILEANHAKITKEEVDGKKRLSYPIKDQNFGIYYYFELQLPAEAPAKISSTFNISDEVLRYLLVRVDERKAKLLAKQASSAKNNSQDTDSKPAEEKTNQEEEA